MKSFTGVLGQPTHNREVEKPMQAFSVLLVLSVSALVMVAPAAGGYRLLQTIPVAGDDGWDHPTVDSAARRLYVTHGTHVVVIDIDSEKVVGKIDDTPGAHFTVIDPELDRGFISNGGAGRLTIFNTKTLSTIGQVKSDGENPGPIAFDPATKRVFTFNLNTHNATVVDPKEGTVVGAFDLGGRPELVGTDAKGSIFVNLVQKNVVLQIDAWRMAAGQTWSVAPCEGPRTMAVDQKNGRLFIGCTNRRMVILDSNNGRVISSVPIGRGPDDSAYDPETGLVYTSNGGDGTVSIIQQESPDTYSVLETVKTGPGARNMALDLKTKKIFLPLFDRGPAPPQTAEAPNPRGDVIARSFRVLVFGN
jgi:DNA-binding beta-propeller fold protein YncE